MMLDSDFWMAVVWGGLSLIIVLMLVVVLHRIGWWNHFQSTRTTWHDADPEPHPARPATAIVVGRAFVCASIDFALGYAVARWVLAATPHQSVRTYIDDEAMVWAIGLLAGGIGWFIGAVWGWFRSGAAYTEPSREEARAWRKAAALVALFAFAVLNLAGWHAAYGWTRIGQPEGTLRLTTFTMFNAGAALVIVTILVLGQRNRFRQAGAVVEAIAAVTILAGSGFRVGSLLPVDRAWLSAWQRGQPEAESFAPNLLTSAPHPCPDASSGSERTAYRNGYPTRRWDTRVGTIELKIPKVSADGGGSTPMGASARRLPRARDAGDANPRRIRSVQEPTRALRASP